MVLFTCSQRRAGGVPVFLEIGGFLLYLSPRTTVYTLFIIIILEIGGFLLVLLLVLLYMRPHTLFYFYVFNFHHQQWHIAIRAGGVRETGAFLS